MFNKMKSKTISRFSNSTDSTSENGGSVAQNVELLEDTEWNDDDYSHKYPGPLPKKIAICGNIRKRPLSAYPTREKCPICWALMP